MRERRRGVSVFICYAFGIALGYAFIASSFSALVVPVIFLCAGFYRFFGRKALLFILAGSIAFSLSWNASDGLERVEKSVADSYNSEQNFAKVVGRVVEISPEGKKLVIKMEGGRFSKSKLMVQSKEELKPGLDFMGRRVEVSGELLYPDTARNPRCFSYKFYLKRQGIDHILNRATLSVLGDSSVLGRLKSGFLRWVYAGKINFYSYLEESIGAKKAGLVLAIVYGERSYIEDADYEVFQRNGLAHILVTSGLHVGILYLIMIFFFGRPQRLTSVLAIFLVLFVYAALVGFTPSIVRAVIMVTIHLPVVILRRKYDMETALALAGLLILIARPLDLFDIGFQLSMITVLTVCRIHRLLRYFQLNRFTRQYIYPVLGVQAVMSPLFAYVFNYFSLVGFLANLMVPILTTLLLQVSLVTAGLSLLGIRMVTLSKSIEVLAGLFYKVNDLLYRSGSFVFDVVSPPAVFVFLWYGILLLITTDEFILSVLRRKYKIASLALAFVCFLSVFFATVQPPSFRNADIVFWDVGQGNSVMVKTQSNKVVLVDGGGNSQYDVGNKVLKPALLKNGISKIDLAVVTHLDDDHFKAVSTLSKQGFVEHMIVSETNREREEMILQETGLNTSQLSYCSAGDLVNIGNDCELHFLWPDKGSESSGSNAEDGNANSLVFTVTMKGYKLLVTGDISENEERRILEKLGGDTEKLSSDILQVAHHGSQYSSCSEFCEAVHPSLSIIPVGKNYFGHPTSQAIERLEEVSSALLRTDMDGGIGIYLSDDIETRRTIQ